jgi:hypothetical protein
MNKAKPCTICGEPTTGLLFNDSWLGIPLCSKKCENEYFSTLSSAKREQMDRLRHINDLINAAKRYETICWIIAGLGLLMIVTAYFMRDATVFLVGVFPLTLGAVFTGYFERQVNKLNIQKRQIVI